jgi:uncharacterized small protein (DUF1192 family)
MDNNTVSLEQYLANKEEANSQNEATTTTTVEEQKEVEQPETEPTPQEEAGKLPEPFKSVDQIIKEKRENRIAKNDEIARLQAELQVAKASATLTADEVLDLARQQVLKEKELDFEELELYRQERAKTEIQKQVEQIDLQTQKDIQSYIKNNPDAKEILGDKQIQSLMIFKRLNPEYQKMDISAVVEDFFGPAIARVKANLSYQTKGKNAPEKPDFRNMSTEDYKELASNPTLKAEYDKDLWKRMRNVL